MDYRDVIEPDQSLILNHGSYIRIFHITRSWIAVDQMSYQV
jgi:hypothetical protein